MSTNLNLINLINGNIIVSVRDLDVGEFSKISGIVFNELIEDTNWQKYTLHSREPLTEEDANKKGGAFYYPIFVRNFEKIVLVLSLNKKIVQEFVNRSKTYVEFIFKYITVNIDELVRKINSEDIQNLKITHLNAEFPSQDFFVQRILFYGNDLINADIFRNNFNLLKFYRCGIKRDSDQNEILIIGNDGSLQFHLRNKESLMAVYEFIILIKKHNLLIIPRF